MRLVNQLESVAVAGDLLLGAVARLSAPDHEVGNSARTRDDAFDPVG